MPSVLRNSKTSEIYTCTLINIYDFAYHGTKFWEDAEEAAGEYAAFLQDRGERDIGAWEVREVEERQLKLFNVKLKNNPANRLYLDERGQTTVKTAN